MDCLTPEELLRIAGDDAPSERARRHLAQGCAACAADLEALRDVLAVLGHARAIPVPETLRRSVRAIPRRAVGGAVRELVGRLLPRAGGVPAFRGGAVGATSHLCFRAGGYDVDLVHLAGGALVGQILGVGGAEPELDEGRCALYGPGEPRSCELTEGGELRFPDVRPGRYTLVVEAGDVRLVVPDLELDEG